jgi:hypothetical protein
VGGGWGEGEMQEDVIMVRGEGFGAGRWMQVNVVNDPKKQFKQFYS